MVSRWEGIKYNICMLRLPAVVVIGFLSPVRFGKTLAFLVTKQVHRCR